MCACVWHISENGIIFPSVIDFKAALTRFGNIKSLFSLSGIKNNRGWKVGRILLYGIIECCMDLIDTESRRLDDFDLGFF